MKKLIFIVPSYFPKTGGVENHVQKVAEEFVNRGYEIFVLVRFDEEIPDKQEVNGVFVLRLPKRTSFPNIIFWYLKNKKLFADILAIHSHDIYLPWLRRFLSSVNWVHTFHGYEGYPIQEAAIKARKKIRSEVPYCICVGDFIERWYGTKCDYTTYGAVSFEKTNVKQTQKFNDVIFFGRLEEDTGFKQYLEAFKEIQKDDPKKTFLVVGNGSLREWGEKFVKENKLKVKFLGSVPSVQQYLTSSKIAFVSGYLGILEAAAAKIPIVAFSGTPIKNDYLELHPMSKNFFIAKSVREIISSFQKADAIEKSRLDEFEKWAKKQTWASIADAYEKSYLKRNNLKL